ncbi:MAG: alkaline phosphatase family protein [Anaerolineales bacterium]|nr:alkaline phosphatase family protein [Anaerolineales bacterium]
MTGRRILFIFLDGVGLGADDAANNPFATAAMPNLSQLLGRQRPLAATPGGDYGRARFIATDAGLGIAGPPQSASGQAAILTGRNVPQEIGAHWGPKPNAAVAAIVREGSVFSRLTAAGKRAALLNAYPQRYFDAIASGRRSYSAIPLAVTAAGLPLFTADDLDAGRALSADFTGAGWPESRPEGQKPYTPTEAGARLAALAGEYDFAFFEYWLTDYVGHRGTLDEARELLATFDAVLSGLLAAWDDAAGLIVITSDHGNLEALDHRHHTLNRVPTLVIGAERAAFSAGLTNLTHLAPASERYLLGRSAAAAGSLPDTPA